VPPDPDASIERRLQGAGLPPLRRAAWIEIDLGALTGNVAAIRRMAGDGVGVLPVVKADAYGHGMIPIARALEGARVDGLCVATLDEAAALVEAGVHTPILVLYPIPVEAVEDAAGLGVALAGGSTEGLRPLLARASALRVADRLSIELEIETGLGRGGVEPAEAPLAARAILAAGARLSGVWSHLQEAEVPEITRAQVDRFEAALTALREAGIEPPRRHLAASGALLLGAVPVYDAVRPGLITYGLIPDELLGNGGGAFDLRRAAAELRPILSLHARPVRVAELPEGHGVSYGPTWRAPVESRIATLPIGYGDGWSRALSNRAEVLVRGVRAPVVGNVAMDATMVDVSGIPGLPVDTDDEFVLLGRGGTDEIPASEVARWRTTNSWEVVTSMSARLSRVYDAAAGPTGARRLGRMEDSWLASSSGTGISATSRSTRS
jgi:alanine racemase